MITIIHGDDRASSRKYFLELRDKIKEPVIFEGDKIGLTELTQTLDGGGLFNEEKSVFIDDFLLKKKPSKEFEEIINTIIKTKNSNLYFWEGKELSKKQISLFKNSKILSFNYPQSIFLFLDSIKPGNGKNLVKLFHQSLIKTEAELIFFMLIRQFRLLIALSNPSNPEQSKEKESIDEIKRLAPWQTGKLKKQADLFSLEELKKHYSKIYEIDLKQKTGSSALTLTQAIDFFLLEI